MASPLILPFVTEDAYAREAGASREVVYAAEGVEAGPPVVFPQPEPEFYDLAPLRYDFPAVTVTTLRDVVVREKSNLLSPLGAVLRHDLIDVATDLIPEEFYERLTVEDEGQSVAWTWTDPFNVDYLPEAAAFVDGVAFNYAHWMTEVLPRIAALTRDARRASIPLIVDANLHPNIMRSIGLVAGPDVRIHRLAPHQLVRVGVLHSVSPSGYVPFMLRPKSKTFSHGLFSGHALREMVAGLRRRSDAGKAGEARPKLLIRRNSKVRHMLNEDAVERALAGRGFEVVEPERLSLEEQVALYSRARMIVGATGAAIVNLMFCQPDCPIIVMMPRFREMAYWYWRRIAAAAGAGPVTYVLGEQIDPYDDPFHPLAVHQDFRVEVKDVLDAVEAAEALSG